MKASEAKRLVSARAAAKRSYLPNQRMTPLNRELKFLYSDIRAHAKLGHRELVTEDTKFVREIYKRMKLNGFWAEIIGNHLRIEW